MLVFGLFLICQISLGSSKFELLLEISARVWSWVVGPFSLGLNLWAAFSCAIDYQYALMILSLMSMSNAKKSYLKGTPDQSY